MLRANDFNWADEVLDAQATEAALLLYLAFKPYCWSGKLRA